jgi:SAM-dependent methyltransferase
MASAFATDPLPASPAAERNKGPLLDVLRRVLPASGTVLEIASGTGQHAEHFAASLVSLRFQPSEADPQSRAVARARVERARLPNLLPPLDIDVRREPWPIERADAILCINMIHISPWAATEALFAGAGRVLAPGAVLCLYGPYLRAGVETAASNAAFDQDLRRRNAEWGLRHLEKVAQTGRDAGFEQVEVVAMPANNLTVVFRRT